MADAPILPPFAQAAEWLKKQLADQGYGGDVRWLFREDVLMEGKRWLIKLPQGGEKAWAEANRQAAELRYEYGRRRGLGARIDLFCLLGDNPCCAVWLPRDEAVAEFAQIAPGALKLRVPASKPPKAMGVSGPVEWALYSRLYGPAAALGLKNRLPLKRRDDFDTERLENLTLRLRASSDPLAVRLRELLQEKDIEPAWTTVAEWRDDPKGLDFGILVTEGKKVFQFVLARGEKGLDEAVFSEWRDLTDEYQELPLASKIRRAVDRSPLSEKEPWEGMFTET